MASLSAALSVFVAGAIASVTNPKHLSVRQVPEQAQVIDWKSFNVLETVLPPAQANGSTVSRPAPKC